MQHIVYVVTQSEWGGAQRYVHDLAIHLPRDRFRVSVVVGEGTGELTHRLEKEKIHVTTIPALRRSIHPRDDVRALHSLTSTLKTLHPDVVHLNSTKAGVLGVLAAHRAHVPRILFTIHGLASEEPHVFGVQRMYRSVERFAFRRMHAVIAVSARDADIVRTRHLVPDALLFHIHNGIDVPTFQSHLLSRDEARQALWRQGVLVDTQTQLVGTISNFYQNKNLPILLRAARHVVAHLPHVRFVMIGDGEERRVLTALTKELGLERTVFFTGSIPYAGNLWNAFDVATLPSRKEGLPYTLIEAACAGVPIVASRVGGVPEIVGDDGVLVDPHDVDALARGIVDVIQQPQWKERATRAEQRVRDHFTLTRMLQETMTHYA